MEDVWCERCKKVVPTAQVDTRYNTPNKGDLTHWHHDMRTDTSHQI